MTDNRNRECWLEIKLSIVLLKIESELKDSIDILNVDKTNI